MAQIPRNLPPTAPTNVSAGRLQGGSRSVATADSTPVEGASPQDGVLFNDALLYQEDTAFDRQSRERSQGNVPLENAGTSQTFAAIFEDTGASGGRDVQAARSRGFANIVARAINIYETNVRVIQGSAHPRGSTLSVSL
jgi:hypothetical protein